MIYGKDNAHNTHEQGFALLLALVVASVVLAIGLSLLEITVKQLDLSSTARESEISFQAAYAGLECADYHRRLDPDGDGVPFDNGFYNGSPLGLDCFGIVPVTPTTQSSPVPHVELYTYQLDASTCVQVDMYVMRDTTFPYSAVTYNFVDQGLNKTCPDGEICTVIISRGYNQQCSDIGNIFTVQREILLEN